MVKLGVGEEIKKRPWVFGTSSSQALCRWKGLSWGVGYSVLYVKLSMSKKCCLTKREGEMKDLKTMANERFWVGLAWKGGDLQEGHPSLEKD